MTVMDQTDQLEYDFEHATWSADHKTLNVWSGAEIPAGANVGTGLGGGGTAAGFSTLAGLITEPELASGTINHALAINVPCTNGVVYPAPQANGLPCTHEQGQTNHQHRRPPRHPVSAQHDRRPDRHAPALPPGRRRS